MKTACLTSWDELYRIGILREETRCIDTRCVRYRFCSLRFVRPEYFIEIVFENERAAESLGGDYPTAQILFDKLVGGTVTPCTLSDIMQDIKNAQNPFTNIKEYDII